MVPFGSGRPVIARVIEVQPVRARRGSGARRHRNPRPTARVPSAQAASLIAVASSTTLAKRSAWCRAIPVTTDPPLCVPAAVALRADLQRPEKLGILVLRIGVVQMRRGQKLIRPDIGEGAIRLRIPQVTRHGPSWGAGWWGAGRLAARHCGLQHPNLTAIKAGPFHHAAFTERPYHVPERTPLSGRRPSLPAVRSRTSARTQSKATASQTAPLYRDVVTPQRAGSRSTQPTLSSFSSSLRTRTDSGRGAARPGRDSAASPLTAAPPARRGRARPAHR
jgi:hypothetical protein